MKLTEALKMDLKSTTVILVGKPEITSILSSDNEPYYLAKLKAPITVRCSVDKDITPFETDEVYLRESALTADGWEFEDPKKPLLGFYMPKWVVDFSKGQEIPVYQAETISKWAKGNRGSRREMQRDRINEGIAKKLGNK